MPPYEVFALAYAGPFTRRGPLLKWLADWDETAEIYYYIWCVRDGERTVVVDSGIAPGDPRVPALDGYIDPTQVLAGLGVTADQVEQVILTHGHFDHILGASLFPRATFWMQRTEYDFWVNDPLARRQVFSFLADPAGLEYLAGLHQQGRVKLVDGDVEIFPGMELLLTPGHTPGMQAVAVQTAQGTVVLGSDCAHVAASYRDDWPGGLTMNLPAALASFDKLRAKVSRPELLFSGHDPSMLREFPQVAPGVTRLA